MTDRSDRDVELLTDEFGVTHVYADDRAALAYGQGYVQARDRLFQMDVLRHVGYGDSAGVLGPGQLESDLAVRRDLYTREELEAQYEALPPTAREMLDAFSAGVNCALVEMIRERDLPAEFLALGHTPHLWEPVDSVAVIGYMIGYFGVFGGDELENAHRYARLCEHFEDDATAWDAYTDLNQLVVPDEHYTTSTEASTTIDPPDDALEFADLPDEQVALAKAASGAIPWHENAETMAEDGAGEGSEGGEGEDGADEEDSDGGGPLSALRSAKGVLSGFRWGSNALALAGEHTETGSPMLFGGPQMGYFRPPVIHEVGLHGGGFDVAGIGVVGSPSIVIGRTPEFAWSVTSGYDDMVDTIAVDLHPEDRTRYRWHGEWREMVTDSVTHRPSLLGALVDGERPQFRVQQDLAWVEENGERMPVVAWNPAENVAWAQRVATRGEEMDAVFSWAELGAADSLEEAAERLAEFPFSFNFLMADNEHVRYVHTGTVPERSDRYDGRLPVPGDRQQWRGRRVGLGLGVDETDPDRGYFAQWNNAPAPGWRAGDVEGRWGEIHRVDLLDDLVSDAVAHGPLDIEDVADIVEDAATRDPVARHSAPAFVRAARDSPDATLRAMADELASWADIDYEWRDGGDGRYDDGGMAVWEAVRRELQADAFGEELGDLAPELVFDPPTWVGPDDDEDPHAGDHARTDRDVAFVRALRGETSHDWLGEDPDETVTAAMERAARELEEEYDSDDPADWRLPVRTTAFAAMGALPEDEIEMVNRGTWNQVVSPAEDRAWGILPPSNRGHLRLTELPNAVRGRVPRRLRDQLGRYEAFRYKPFPVNRERVEQRADRVETLRVGRLASFPRLRALFGR